MPRKVLEVGLLDIPAADTVSLGKCSKMVGTDSSVWKRFGYAKYSKPQRQISLLSDARRYLYFQSVNHESPQTEP